MQQIPQPNYLISTDDSAFLMTCNTNTTFVIKLTTNQLHLEAGESEFKIHEQI
jgi:hypothetical protein